MDKCRRAKTQPGETFTGKQATLFSCSCRLFTSSLCGLEVVETIFDED